MTDVRYRYYRRYTNQYGLPLSHGHGVAIRLALLEHGLPELISEDIAMSIGLRQAGYRGLFLKEPLCQEATADDLTAFCRRERRCMAADIECLITKALPMITARGVRLVEKWDLLIRQLRYPVKLFFTFSIAFAVISSVSGWATCCRLGLASPVAKSVWLLAALIPWAAYFRFFGFRRVLAALDFLLVSLPTHISCMILHLEGTALGLWLVIKGEQYLPCPSGVDHSAISKLWVPANAKVRYAPSILGDWLRYLLPGLTIATVGAIWLRWELISIGISPIAVWMATRKPLDEKVGALVVRSAGFVVMLTLLMYMVLPSSDYVSDLVVLSLAVILF